MCHDRYVIGGFHSCSASTQSKLGLHRSEHLHSRMMGASMRLTRGIMGHEVRHSKLSSLWIRPCLQPESTSTLRPIPSEMTSPPSSGGSQTPLLSCGQKHVPSESGPSNTDRVWFGPGPLRFGGEAPTPAMESPRILRVVKHHLDRTRTAEALPESKATQRATIGSRSSANGSPAHHVPHRVQTQRNPVRMCGRMSRMSTTGFFCYIEIVNLPTGEHD